MKTYQRVKLATMIMLLGFLIVVARTTIAPAFPAEHFSPHQRGMYLIQDEGKAPQMCLSIEGAIKRLIVTDPKVTIYRHTSAEDNSSAIIAEFSSGSGVLMVIEPGEMVCEGMPLSPMQVLLGRQSVEAEGSKIATVQLWPKEPS